MPRSLGLLGRHVSVLLLATAIGFLASGCLWGVVTDAQSGAPLRGVVVTCTDANNQTFSSTTNEFGIYAFDMAAGPIPAAGNASMNLSVPGLDPVTEARLLEFNEPGFREVQNFNLGLLRHHNAQGGFSILLPPSWTIDEGFFGVGTFIAEPPSGHPDFPGDISVGATDFAADMTLEEWRDYSTDGVCNVTVDCAVTESGETTIAGVRAVWSVVTYTLTSNPAIPPRNYAVGQRLQELAYFLKKGDTGYIIDLTATAENFARLRGQYESIGLSFQFD